MRNIQPPSQMLESLKGETDVRTGTILLATLVSLPLTVVAVRALAIDLRNFSDPCFHWGVGSEGHFSGSLEASVRLDDPCARRYSSTSEAKKQALIRLLIVPGGILAAVAFAMLGAVRSRPVFAVVGACLMLLEAVPTIFSVAPIAVLTGLAYLLVAKKARSGGSVPSI